MVVVVCTIELIKLGITKVTFQMGQPQTPFRSSSETRDIIDDVEVRRVCQTCSSSKSIVSVGAPANVPPLGVETSAKTRKWFGNARD